MDARTRKKAADALAESRTLTEAAERIGVDRRTLYRWLRDDSELNQAALDAVELLDIEQHERLLEAEDRACDALWEVIESEETGAADRVRALKEVLELVNRRRGVGIQRLRLWQGRLSPLYNEFLDSERF